MDGREKKGCHTPVRYQETLSGKRTKQNQFFINKREKSRKKKVELSYVELFTTFQISAYLTIRNFLIQSYE